MSKLIRCKSKLNSVVGTTAVYEITEPFIVGHPPNGTAFPFLILPETVPRANLKIGDSITLQSGNSSAFWSKPDLNDDEGSNQLNGAVVRTGVVSKILVPLNDYAPPALEVQCLVHHT